MIDFLNIFNEDKLAKEGQTSSKFRQNANYCWEKLASVILDINKFVGQINAFKNDIDDIKQDIDSKALLVKNQAVDGGYSQVFLDNKHETIENLIDTKDKAVSNLTYTRNEIDTKDNDAANLTYTKAVIDNKIIVSKTAVSSSLNSTSTTRAASSAAIRTTHNKAVSADTNARNAYNKANHPHPYASSTHSHLMSSPNQIGAYALLIYEEDDYNNFGIVFAGSMLEFVYIHPGGRNSRGHPRGCLEVYGLP